MRLQRHSSRRLGAKEYEKWVIVVPKTCIERLGWGNGLNLTAEAQGDLLIIRPRGKQEVGDELVEHTYEEFRDSVRKGLQGEKEGLTWLELRKKGRMDQKRPFNQWVRRLEKDIGLIREKRRGQTYWRLPR